MVALLTSASHNMLAQASYWCFCSGGEVELTRTIVPREDERCSSTVQLRASVEDEFVRWQTVVGHCTGHIVCRTVDDVVTKDVLALPESAVV